MVDYPVEEENLNIRSMNSEGKNGLKNVISWGYISAGLRSSPVGSGGGGGSAGSYSRTVAGNRTQLEAGDKQVHEIKKNQSPDKTVNIDISTKAG